jgi:predicted lactoylglutathione lyase
MPVAPRLSLVTLGVEDVGRSTTFYEALGWQRSSASVEGEVTFLRTAGSVLGLWRASSLAADAGVSAEGDGFRRVALACNLDSPESVDAAVDTWVAAGGTVVRPPHATDWGGYSGYLADPDGHLWEVAHNPHWATRDDGTIDLPI